MIAEITPWSLPFFWWFFHWSKSLFKLACWKEWKRRCQLQSWKNPQLLKRRYKEWWTTHKTLSKKIFMWNHNNTIYDYELFSSSIKWRSTTTNKNTFWPQARVLIWKILFVEIQTKRWNTYYLHSTRTKKKWCSFAKEIQNWFRFGNNFSMF